MTRQLRMDFKASDEMYSIYDGETFKIVGKSEAGHNIIEFYDGYQIEAEEDEIYV